MMAKDKGNSAPNTKSPTDGARQTMLGDAKKGTLVNGKAGGFYNSSRLKGAKERGI